MHQGLKHQPFLQAPVAHAPLGNPVCAALSRVTDHLCMFGCVLCVCLCVFNCVSFIECVRVHPPFILVPAAHSLLFDWQTCARYCFYMCTSSFVHVHITHLPPPVPFAIARRRAASSASCADFPVFLPTPSERAPAPRLSMAWTRVWNEWMK